MHKEYCVIGDPVEHSLSPMIYNTLFSHYGLDNCTYAKKRVSAETLPGFIASIQQLGICGFNVTMPLKTAVLPYLNYQDASIVCGANTVVVESTSGLAGWSTDAQGFERNLEQNGHSFRGARVVFLGSGGAAQALVHAASREAAAVTVLNRTPEHAAPLAKLPGVSVGLLNTENIACALPDCTLLINCTPLGMTGVQSNFADLSFLAKLPKAALVCDLIYDPPQTQFLAEAARTGHPVLNGLGMLIWQAFYAFEKFTGILPDMNAFAAVSDC